MIRSVIIDDEPGNRKILRRLLETYCPDVMISGEADAADTGIKVLKEIKPDLVFLDIEMPYGNAFTMLNQLMPVSFKIIFVTAFNNYALNAFRYNALDYLLKPVNIEELKAAVERARSAISNKGNINDQLQNLLAGLKPDPAQLQKIALPTQDGLNFVELNNIIRCEAVGAYTRVFMKGDEQFLSSKGLKEYEEMLPGDLFCRIHHSHIINLNHIRKYQKGRGGFVIMADGSTIDVSARKKDDFLSKFGI